MLDFEIKEKYKPLFTQHGLHSFKDIFSYNKGEIVDKNRKRCVVRFTLYDPSIEKKRVFYLKLFHTCALQENVNSILEWRYPKSEAKTEWDNAQILEQQGFLTIPCVAYGEYKEWGMVKQSFFISEEIVDSESLDLLYNPLNQEIKQKIVTELGYMVKRLHEKLISFPDLYTKHLFFNKQDLASGKITVSLIDLHRMRKKKRLSTADKIRDLAALLFTLEPLCSQDEITNFTCAYTHNSCASAKWYKALNRRINRLRKRRSTDRGILIRHLSGNDDEMYVNEEYFPFFETHGILSCDAVFKYKTEKKKFTDNPGRTVQRFTLKHAGREQSFFIKKHTPVNQITSSKK